MPTLLVVEDEEPFAKNIASYLGARGWDVEISLNAEDALARVASIGPDVILLDFNLPGISGLAAMEMLRDRDPYARIVMLTGQSSVQLAVDAMKAGARDFLVKPVTLAGLGELLGKLMRDVRIHKEVSYRHSKGLGSANDLIGESAVMVELRQRIRRAVEIEPEGGFPPSILITGETGSGKELVARACHAESRRRDGPFLEVNCSAIPVNLLESELFGHERGAFTDARERRIGLIEAADGGTLFLDEIGEMDVALQAKLLKFLDDHRVRRLGGLQERRVDLRVIAATNRDLGQRVQEGVFRADLYHRLGVVRFGVPSLRERRGDIALLARHFLTELGARYGKPDIRLADKAVAALDAHRWPGNVRELRNLIEQAVLIANDSVIDLPDLMLAEPVIPAAIGGGAVMELATAEAELIRNALEQSGWNVVHAAAALGVTRDTLRYRIKRLGLRRPESRGRSSLMGG